MTDHILKLLSRDLLKLKEEMLSYSNEENIWVVSGETSNTAGNLCLHLIGNLNAFIGAELGNTGYVRQRDDEFGLRNVPRELMIEGIDNVITMIQKVIPQLTEKDLIKDFAPVTSMGPIPTSLFLMHLCTHLSYHLGQINYHRRILDN